MTVWPFSSETIKIACDLNGVNSRIDKIVGPTIMLSPYFDDTALSLFKRRAASAAA